MAEPPIDSVLASGMTGAIQEISKEEILRQIFGDVGELIDDFTCAVESTVLLHGRLYVTSKFICFYSNLFGLEKKIRIPYSHIKSIMKANTALVIPNAIAISTEKREYVFRSFWDRDECHRMLSLFLQKYNANDLSRQSIMGMLNPKPLDTNNNFPIDSLVPDDAIPIPEPVVRDNRRTSGNYTNSVRSERPRSASASVVQTTHNGATNANDDVIDTESGAIPTAGDDSLDRTVHYEQEVAKARLKLPVITNSVIDVSLDDFLRLFVTESAPYSYQRYHEMVKDTNLVVSPWEESGGGLGKGREIKFFKPVNLPGLASTRGVKVQRYVKFGDYGAMVVSSTRLEDVPAADTFSVDDLLAVHVTSDGKLSVEISFQVSFVKPTFMKYIIERSTNAEMTKWLECFYQHLTKVCEDFKAGIVTLDGVGRQQPQQQPAVAAGPPPPLMMTVQAVEPPSTIFMRPTTPLNRSNSSSVAGVAVKRKGFFRRLFDEFLELSFVDQVKIYFALLLLVFLVLNFYRWKNTHRKMNALEAKIELLEKMMQKLLPHSPPLPPS